MTAVGNLRCEHLDSPMGVEVPAPGLSWQIQSTRRGTRQIACRILAATSPDRLSPETADLWDSGRADSDTSVMVPYKGRNLRSRQRCWWKVIVWDESGAEIASEPAWWEMGLLNAGDWKARWMAGKPAEQPGQIPPAPLFRKTFHLSKPVASARAYVCGLGFHEFYLNGKKAGDAVLHPAFTKYDRRALYTVHDVTDLISQGANAAGIVTGTGWYNHHVKDVWDLYAAPWRDEPKALAQIEIVFEDGTRKTIASDASWKCSTGPILFDSLRDGEVYDAREEKDGWTGGGYDDSGWVPVRIARPPGGVLRAMLMPPCKVTETIRPASAKEIRPGVWLFDLGRNIAGWARLKVSGPAGTKVVLKYSERLGADGDIDNSIIRALAEATNFQTDTYILRGNGTEVWEPRFVYHGFQYIQATGLPEGCNPIEVLDGRVVHTAMERTGRFECSDDLLNRIQNAATASMMSNYHGMPTDCPHREKNGWTGDALLSTEQILFNFDPAASLSKWLDDFSDCQRTSGALPGIVPTGGWGYNWGAGPAWDSAYLFIPWYLYLYRGDLEILRRHYEGMKRYLSFLDAMAPDKIVYFGLGDWCPPGPRVDDYPAPAELTNTGWYYADARLVARVAALLGKKSDARKYETLAKQIKSAARKKFIDKKTGRLAGHGQTAIACFLYQGLCEEEETDRFLEMLAEEIEAADRHIGCGILGTKFTMNELTRLGRADLGLAIAFQRTYPSWGCWLEQGATTLWECWDGQNSRNHHMFSDISAWFYKTLAGIVPDPERPGFKHTIVKPWPVGDIRWAKGEVETPYGNLSSAWKIDNGRFILEVSIPPNSEASVYLPVRDASKVQENGQPAGRVDGMEFQGMIDGRAVYRIGSGDFRFDCPME